MTVYMKGMNGKMDNRPIGMFDSGVGGLTVFKEVKKQLPNENIVYLGDTKRFPYGSKSKESIIELTKQGIEFLIGQNVKLIVIACGTATSQALEEVKKMLDGGAKPDEIINEHLIAAINEVGELFDKKKYFLPQLISSANTMKLAIEYLEPMLERSNTEAMATIVVATVEGDIHDIGKNIVVLMLKNYGYHVIDLGKDVPADVIVDTAMNEGAKVIGLSALMTTTMMRMKDVVELAKEKGCTAKIVIGGAAITESFSDEIGADGYSKDAAECVKLVERLLA